MASDYYTFFGVICFYNLGYSNLKGNVTLTLMKHGHLQMISSILWNVGKELRKENIRGTKW